MSGRYASYWNAFLFKLFLPKFFGIYITMQIQKLVRMYKGGPFFSLDPLLLNPAVILTELATNFCSF